MSERAFALAFGFIKQVGPVRIRRFLKHFGSLERAWAASLNELVAAGLTEKAAANQLECARSIDPSQVQDHLDKMGIRAVLWDEPEYPPYLAQIAQPPHVLFYKGTLTPADNLSIAIVGTRNITPYGKQVTADITRYLVGNGVTIVSGLARGVDAVAHKTALGAGGRTIAVLGSGVDVIYPPEHRRLAAEISTNGAVISSYPPGTKPDGINFPPRNRIISGLSRATVVVEAGERSGALITADFAVDQGRDVFAVPGSVLQPMSMGTNNLIAKGAIPMTSPAMILEHLNIPQRALQTAALPSDLDDNEKKILHALSTESRHIDELSAALDMPAELLGALLTLMELKNLVSRDTAQNYSAIRDWKY